MPSYRAPLRDMRFVLDEYLAVGQYRELPGFEDLTPDLTQAILEESGKLAEQVLAPLNSIGDREGCTWSDGEVRTPKGFADAYKAYRDGGWTGLTGDTRYGGQGLPHVLGLAVSESMSAANMAFAMYPGLTSGAIDAITAGGSDEQKAVYLPKLISGEWTGTMNLTEPHCGTDLGLLRTRAEPREDGSYTISGTKIFISAGEHDLAENIIHLVLARIPGGPPGVKGISLFIVPKYLPSADGACGARNNLRCGRIEEKMGIHGNATCEMQYDGAQGFLIGEPHKGLRIMFIMMNAARLGVAMQGLSIADVAYQNAIAYARERRQGRALAGAAEPQALADPIVVHPDVRRMLMNQRVFVEGARALGYWTGLQVDLAHKHEDAQVCQDAEDLLALLTPVIKSHFTDQGFHGCNQALQCFGGHGYIREWGVEQFVRDARIAQIYEGANGIQALDLVGRKLPAEGGRAIRLFMTRVAQACAVHAEVDGLGGHAKALAAALDQLTSATGYLASAGVEHPDNAAAGAADYLELVALVALGWQWLGMAATASRALAAGEGDAAFYTDKLALCRYFFQRVLPAASGHLERVTSGADPVMGVPADRL